MTRATRWILLYSAGGLLLAGLLLEDEPASHFGFGATTIPDHRSVLLFATVSIVLSFWPSALAIWKSATSGRAHWTLLPIAAVAIGMVLGWILAAATFAFVFALVSFIRVGREPSRQR